MPQLGSTAGYDGDYGDAEDASVINRLSKEFLFIWWPTVCLSVCLSEHVDK